MTIVDDSDHLPQVEHAPQANDEVDLQTKVDLFEGQAVRLPESVARLQLLFASTQPSNVLLLIALLNSCLVAHLHGGPLPELPTETSPLPVYGRHNGVDFLFSISREQWSSDGETETPYYWHTSDESVWSVLGVTIAARQSTSVGALFPSAQCSSATSSLLASPRVSTVVQTSVHARSPFFDAYYSLNHGLRPDTPLAAGTATLKYGAGPIYAFKHSPIRGEEVELESQLKLGNGAEKTYSWVDKENRISINASSLNWHGPSEPSVWVRPDYGEIRFHVLNGIQHYKQSPRESMREIVEGMISKLEAMHDNPRQRYHFTNSSHALSNF